MPSKVSIPSAVAKIEKVFSPKLVASINGSHDLKIAKVKGSFVWHSHPDTEELFYVIGGAPLTIQFREKDGGDIVLNVGDMLVIPQGVEHCPVAEEESEILMIEKIGTVNTGDAAPR
jgi:mannose-6-phosphate isomerase-like protein (cupin superfamily)